MMKYLKLIFIFLLLPFFALAQGLKREGDVAYDKPVMYATQKVYKDCDNPFGHLAKQVKIIQGDTRNRVNTDPSGGFIVSDTEYQGGRASLVGFGNIAVSVAHGIIDVEKGGFSKHLKMNKNGKVYFYTSNPPFDRVEIDLEKSEFGCRKSYKDPLPDRILNMPTSTPRERSLKIVAESECDWAVLRLKENLTKGRHQGKSYAPLDWEYSIDRHAFNVEMEKGNIYLITADPKNGLSLYTERFCPRPSKTIPRNYTGKLNYHGCDIVKGDSGSGFILEKNGKKHFVGLQKSEIRSGGTNIMILFDNEFFSKFSRVAQIEAKGDEGKRGRRD